MRNLKYPNSQKQNRNERFILVNIDYLLSNCSKHMSVVLAQEYKITPVEPNGMSRNRSHIYNRLIYNQQKNNVRRL